MITSWTEIAHPDGSKKCFVNGKYHRTEYPDGSITTMWYCNCSRHREDGPAIEYANGGKEWYINGNLHRTDGPAVEHANGKREWWVNGKQHRTGSPAVEYADASEAWYVEGKRHREDGPAIVSNSGKKYWWLNNQCLTLEEFVQQTPYLTSDAERLAFYLRCK